MRRDETARVIRHGRTCDRNVDGLWLGLALAGEAHLAAGLGDLRAALAALTRREAALERDVRDRAARVAALEAED